MTKKLRMTSKQKLTTLAILGAVAGMGLQVDTAKAAVVNAAGDATASSTGTSTAANDPTTKQAVISNGSQTSAAGAKTTTDAVSQTKVAGETTTRTVTDPETPANTSKVTSPDTVKTDDPSVTPENTIVAGEATPDKNVNDGSQQTDDTRTLTAIQPQRRSRANLLRDVAPAPTIKNSGTNGTAHWTEDTNGVVTITGGTMAESMMFFESATKLVFDGSLGKVVLPANSSRFFEYWSNLTEIDGWENVDASKVTNMSHMFSEDVALKSLDLSSLDLSHVTNMSSLLYGGISDQNGNHPISLTNFKLGSSTSQVTDMSMMLSGDSSLTTVDAADWNVSSLQSADSLFQGTAISNLDLSKWQTPKLQTLSNTFADMPNLSSINVAGLQTGSVTNFVQTFENDPLLTTVDVSQWDVSGSQFFTSMFHDDPVLANLDLSNWHPQAVLQMNLMFDGDSALTALNLSGFDTISGGRGTATVNEALLGTNGLHELVLGPNTSLGDASQNADLPDIPVTKTYTGLWQAVGTGTVEKPNGATYTSAQLNATYNGATMADTYVWQQVPTTTPTNPGTTPDNPGATTDNPGMSTEPTDPDSNPNTDGNDNATVNGGDGDAIVTTDKDKTKKPVVHATVKPQQVATTTNGGKLTTLSAGQGATATQKATQSQVTTTSQTNGQSDKTTLPQTNEKKSSLWAAIGAVMLGILSFHWYKRQD